MLKLTLDQAQELHDLLTKINIESLKTLITGFNPLIDHPLWPVLDTLRQQIQIHQFTDDATPQRQAQPVHLGSD